MTGTHTPTVAALLAGLAVLSLGAISPVSASPSPWESGADSFSEVIEDTCDVAGFAVLYELSAEFRSRFVTSGADGLPYLQEQSDDTEVYTNVASGESVTVFNHRTVTTLQVTDNGDGTLTTLDRRTDHQAMYDADGRTIAHLRTGSLLVEHTIDHAGTPTDPSDDQTIAVSSPTDFESTGRSDDFCTALVQAIG